MLFLGKRVGRFPFGSAIMIKAQNAWVELISELCGLPHQTCRSILGDPVLAGGKSQDLHIRPFVSVGTNQDLAVAPQFPLHSHVEANILRICSDSRPAIYQAMSDEKERDMLAELKDRLKQRDVSLIRRFRGEVVVLRVIVSHGVEFPVISVDDIRLFDRS